MCVHYFIFSQLTLIHLYDCSTDVERGVMPLSVDDQVWRVITITVTQESACGATPIIVRVCVCVCECVCVCVRVCVSVIFNGLPVKRIVLPSFTSPRTEWGVMNRCEVTRPPSKTQTSI